MPEESHEDSIRRIMGVPTTAQRAVQEAAEMRRKREWEEGEPARQELARKFKDTVNQQITTVFTVTKPVVAEGRLTIAEEPKRLPLPPNVLALRSFAASLASSGTASRGPLVAPLSFTLQPDGDLRIDVPRIESSPPTVPVPFSSRTFDLADVAPVVIEDAFKDYLRGVMQALSSRQS